MFKKVVTESIDDKILIEEIRELENLLNDKKNQLRELRKQGVLKYCEEMNYGEILYNLYDHTCYVRIDDCLEFLGE